MKHIFLTAAFIAAMTGSALAGACPGLMNKVDKALPSTTISAEDKAKVMALRATGEQQHSSGQHAESVASLKAALKLLGM